MLLEGIARFNRGEYFEQHETLETLWRAEPGDVRYLYQGILLVGVGCYHLSRGNRTGAVAKLRTGIALLRRFEPACQGVDVDLLVADAQRLLLVVEAADPRRLGEIDRALYPRVYLVGKRETDPLGTAKGE
jgi:hypothetical protein